MTRKMAEEFRKIALELGEASESRVEQILLEMKKEKKLPPWLIGFKRLTHWSPGDRKGMDFIIFTTKRKIRVNIKSSESYARIFKTNHKNDDIIPIVVNLMDKDEKVFAKFLTQIGGVYRKMK